MAGVLDWLQVVLSETAAGLARNILLLVSIIVPLMIGIEFMRAGRAMDRLGRMAAPAVRLLGLSPKAAFPLISGIVFGLNYGAGVILDTAREGELTAKDRRLLVVFLVACHAAIEDTLLFVPFGVDPFALLGSRVALAIALTWAASRFMRREPLESAASRSGGRASTG